MLSPWVTLLEHDLVCNGRVETFHALDQADYVNVLALTPEGQVSLVRQFRPGVNRLTLELPGGLRDGAEEPVVAAVRELREEVGLEAIGDPILLASLAPDPGRLQNRLWAYFVPHTKRATDWQPEASIEPLALDRQELLNHIDGGQFDHAQHLGIIGLAMLKCNF